MSLLSRDRLFVAIAPGQLRLLKQEPTWRGSRPLLSATVDCGTESADDGGASSWTPLLAALRETLREPRWTGCAATVLLSDHFVRYQLIPWDEQLVTDEEQEAMVRHAFVGAYGSPAENWSFRHDVQPPPAPCLASAVDSGLIEGLRDIFAHAALKLVSIQPRLMASFNHHRRQLPTRGDCWFLTEEPGKISLAWLHGDAPSALYSQRADADWSDTLPQLLERGLLLAGAGSAPGAVYLSLAAQRQLPAALPEGWSPHPLQPDPLLAW